MRSMIRKHFWNPFFMRSVFYTTKKEHNDKETCVLSVAHAKDRRGVTMTNKKSKNFKEAYSQRTLVLTCIIIHLYAYNTKHFFKKIKPPI